MHFRPISFLLLFFVLGITFGYLNAVKGASFWWALLILPFAAVVYLLSLPWKKGWIWLLPLLLVSVLGCLSFRAALSSFQSAPTYEGRFSVTGTVTEKETLRYGCRVTLEGITIDGNAEDEKLVAYLPADFDVRLAQKVALYGEVYTDTALLQSEYGFRAEAVTDGKAYVMSEVSDVTVIKTSFRPLLLVRRLIGERISAMEDPAAAVCLGLLTGDDSGIDGELLRNIRGGGIAHLFAVSGLHIGVVFGVCLWLTKRKWLANRGKVFAFVLTALLLLFYGGVCGFSASVTRAIITCLAAYAHTLIGLKRDGVETLSFAALAVTAIFPAQLFDVGFLLSFAAGYGILLLARPLREGLDRLCIATSGVIRGMGGKPAPKPTTDIFQGDTSPKPLSTRVREKITGFLGVTLAAWVSTAPVSLTFFSSLSVWGLLLNCIFVPLTSAFFVLLAAFTLLACVLPASAAGVVLYLPKSIISVMILVFEVFSFPAAELSVNLSGTALYYLGWLFVTDKFRLPRKVKAAMALSLLVGGLLCWTLPV